MGEITKHIVAIGGGEVLGLCKTPETIPIDRYIVDLALGKLGRTGSTRKMPNVLFIPTASGDNIYYCNTVYNLYQLRLHCKYDHLRVIAQSLTTEEIQAKINWADIIYVGGGNTLNMMRVWRRLGIDKMLIKAYNSGTVMCGLSAGAICWFESGISDSRKTNNPENWKPICVSGLGILPGICCPHYDKEGDWRVPACEKILRNHRSSSCIALDNLMSIHVINDIMYYTVTPTKIERDESKKRCLRLRWEKDALSIKELRTQGYVNAWQD
jgi:dipeptidase E